MRMRSFLLMVAILCLLMGRAGARSVDLSAPSAQVGSADINGDVQLVREIDGAGLDLGPGSYLPLRYKFSTAANTGGMLGPNFYCPIFEARNILIREQMMRAFLPCGKGLYLRRDNTDATKFQTVNQEWTGLLSGDDFTIWRDDGWKLTYHQGRLTTLQTDNNHTFTWSYNDNGIATKVSEDGQSRIGVETDPQGQLSAFTCDGKRYTVDFAERPSIEVLNGQVVVGKLVSSLSAFHYPDGKTETCKILLTSQRIPTLEFIAADQKETDYTWDAATGHIATEKGPEGSWTYQVGDVDGQYGTPPIFRTNAAGKTEGIALDGKGTYTATNLDGSTVITHVFDSPGPLFGKVRKVEKDVDGNMTTVYEASYDEMGRLIRQVDGNGFTSKYIYGDNKLVKKEIDVPSDPALLRSLEIQANGLLLSLANSVSKREHNDSAENLAFFYIYKLGNYAKASSLISQMTDRQAIFNIRMHLVVGNPNFSKAQQADGLEKLLADFPEQRQVLTEMINRKRKESKTYDL